MAPFPPQHPSPGARRSQAAGGDHLRLQGFRRVTADADVTPSPETENLERLAGALRELRARRMFSSTGSRLSHRTSVTDKESLMHAPAGSQDEAAEKDVRLRTVAGPVEQETYRGIFRQPELITAAIE